MVLERPFRVLLAHAYPYRWWFAGSTLCGLLKYNIPLVYPWVLKEVLDGRLDARLDATMLSLVLVTLAWVGIAYLRSRLADRAAHRLIFDVSRRLHAHIQRLSLGYFESRHVGSIASRLLHDVGTAQNFVGGAFANTLMDASALVLIACLLVRMNPRLAAVALAVLPVYAVLNRHFKRRIKATSKLVQEKREEIAGDVQEKLRGISLIQSFGLERVERRDYFGHTREQLGNLFAHVDTNAATHALVNGLTHLAPVIVIWFGAHEVAAGRLSTGSLAAFYAYLGMLYGPLNRLTDFNIMVANSRSAMERIVEVLDTPPEIADREGARDPGRVRGEVRFAGVRFGYGADDRDVLEAIDLRVPAGRTVALVGPSGSGKSTLVKLIPRFYDVREGAVTIDGHDVRDLRVGALRREIALVAQEPLLFSGSVRDNIACGRRGATEAEVRDAAALAHADEFIRALPRGYESEVGEAGVRLSRGQKQRIALARAFLKDAPILILDEATCSLDSESEALIQRALRRLMRDRTTIVVAHRLSTVRSADTIVALRDGRIAETGTHEELLTRPDGLYRRLYDEQLALGVEEDEPVGAAA